MGTFNFPAPVAYIHATPVGFKIQVPWLQVMRVTSFRTSYLQDPWVLPSPCESVDGHTHVRMAMPLSAVEVTYQAIQHTTADPDQTPAWTEEDDQYPEPIWAHNSSTSQDCLDIVMPSDEAIIEAMTGSERPWEDMHHRSYFLPEISHVERGEFKSVVSRNDSQTVNPLAKHGVYVEGNMVNISETIPINISRTPDVVENVFIRAELFSR
jgi:hypothetical protein